MKATSEILDAVSERTSIVNLILMFLFLSITGNPYLYGSNVSLVLFFVPVLIVFVLKKRKIDLLPFLVLVSVLIIELLQAFSFNTFSVTVSLGIVIRILLAYFIVKLLNHSFIETYQRTVLFIAKVSLILFGVFLIAPTTIYNVYLYIANLVEVPLSSQIGDIYNRIPSFLIYTVHPVMKDEFRNAGCFWEPGAFAVFLNLALAFELLSRGTIFTKRGWWYIATVITTLSTAGLAVLFMLILGEMAVIRRNISALVFAACFVVAGFVAYQQLDFLGKKIETNIYKSNNTSSRFVSAQVDMADFIERPFTGWGRGSRRVSDQLMVGRLDLHRNNGVTYLLSTYGIVFFCLYFILVWRSFKSLSAIRKGANLRVSIAILSLVLSGFSQGIFLREFFFSLLFLSLVYKVSIEDLENPHSSAENGLS